MGEGGGRYWERAVMQCGNRARKKDTEGTSGRENFFYKF